RGTRSPAKMRSGPQKDESPLRTVSAATLERGRRAGYPKGLAVVRRPVGKDGPRRALSETVRSGESSFCGPLRIFAGLLVPRESAHGRQLRVGRARKPCRPGMRSLRLLEQTGVDELVVQSFGAKQRLARQGVVHGKERDSDNGQDPRDRSPGIPA